MVHEPQAPPDPFEGIPADELPSQELRIRALAYVNKVRTHFFLKELEALTPGRKNIPTLNPICMSIRTNSESMRAQIIDGQLVVGEARKGIWNQKETAELPEEIVWFLKAHEMGAYPDLLRSTEPS